MLVILKNYEYLNEWQGAASILESNKYKYIIAVNT